jgi:hypothetical protein
MLHCSILDPACFLFIHAPCTCLLLVYGPTFVLSFLHLLVPPCSLFLLSLLFPALPSCSLFLLICFFLLLVLFPLLVSASFCSLFLPGYAPACSCSNKHLVPVRSFYLAAACTCTQQYLHASVLACTLYLAAICTFLQFLTACNFYLPAAYTVPACSLYLPAPRSYILLSMCFNPTSPFPFLILVSAS